MNALQLKHINGHKLLYVMAAEPEYGSHLKEAINPLMTGIGPIEAAMNLASAMSTLNEKPDLIVSLGSAGSNKLKQTEIYQVSSVSYRDMDASPLGFEKGTTPLLDLPKSLELKTYSLKGHKSASLSTGANIISGVQYNTIEEDMVDMETFALKRVAMTFDVPLLGLRGISDGKDELKELSDWTQYLEVIDQKLANAVNLLEAVLEQSAIL